MELNENALNDAGWKLIDAMNVAGGQMNAQAFNNLKPALRLAIVHYLTLAYAPPPVRRAEGATRMSKETISAVLSEVLDENDDSISAGAFDEIVDRLAAPAKGATLGDGATDHEGRPLTYWGGKTPHSLAAPPPTGEAVAWADVEPNLFVRMTRHGEDRMFRTRAIAESSLDCIGEITEYVRVPKDKSIRATIRYITPSNPAAQAEGRGWNDAIEAAAKEAEHWQEISKTGHECGRYIAGAIRTLTAPADAEKGNG